MSKLIGTRVLALLFAVMSLVGCSGEERTYKFLEGGDLTEEVAINYSRNALRDAGVSVKSARPVMYWPAETPDVKDRYFARNADDENRGYVLWKVDDSAEVWNYQVTVVRDGARIRCTIGRAN